MRQLIVILLLFIGFANVAVAIDANDISGARQTIESIDHTGCSSEANHNSPDTSHQCHFGHCCFLPEVGPSLPLSNYSTEIILLDEGTKLDPFLLGLFRPPII